MLISSAEKLRRMRDGRAVYVGAERIGDVTAHRAFAAGAQAVAAFYDLKASAGYRDDLTCEEDGARHSIWWLRPRNRDDLARRMRGNKALADMSFGFFGRSPDHIGSLVSGLAMKPSVLESLHKGRGDNLMRYYAHARDEDIYLSYAVTPPSGVRSSEATPGAQVTHPSLRVVREEDDGVVISGMKMLATAAVYADDIWIGNLQPLDESRLAESITCAIPIATPGLSLWARQPYAMNVRDPLDYPLSYRLDESDCVLVCEDVKVPWERIFLHNNAAKSRAIYLETPANCLANHQSNCRFWAKMSLIVGLASRACMVNGVDKIPAVREQLGRLAALEATIGALVHGQIDALEAWPEGYVTPNRRMMYAALNWCQEHHTEIIDTLRTLMGGCAAADAGGQQHSRRSGAECGVRALVGHARHRGGRTHEALQTRVGHYRLGVRRTPPALREILRRARRAGARVLRPRSAVGPVPRDGRSRTRNSLGGFRGAEDSGANRALISPDRAPDCR